MSLSAHTLERLAALCAHLQAHGFKLAQSRVISAAHLLDARGLSLDHADAGANALVLRPALCSNAREQHCFSQLVESWVRTNSAGQPVCAPVSSKVADTFKRSLQWLGPALLLLAFLALGATAYGIYGMVRPPFTPHVQAMATNSASESKVTSTEKSSVTVLGDMTFPPHRPLTSIVPAAYWSVAFGLLLVAGLLWLRHGARLKRRRAAQGLDSLRLSNVHNARLYSLESAARALGQSFRQPLRTFGPQLDQRKSVEASARRGGLFTGVYGAPRERRFLALVRRQAMHDHQAWIGEALTAQLCRSGADIMTFRFEIDANVVEPYKPDGSAGGKAEQQRYRVFPLIEDILAANEHAECLLFCEPVALLDPLSGHLAPWSRKIVDIGHRCTVFTVAAVHRWEPAWGVLSGAGIAVVSIDPEALDALAQGRHSIRSVPHGKAANPMLHSEFHLHRGPPSASEARAICDAIRDELGYVGYRWVQACAVYPVIQWPLTNALGELLVQNEGERARLLLRVADLVWFRKAYMPDWLRAALIAQLDAKVNKVIRDFFWEQFAKRMDEDNIYAALDVARSNFGTRVHSFVNWLRVTLALSARVKDGSLKEQLFATYLLGRNDLLSMRIPQRVTTNTRYSARQPAIFLASFCTLGTARSYIRKLSYFLTLLSCVAFFYVTFPWLLGALESSSWSNISQSFGPYLNQLQTAYPFVEWKLQPDGSPGFDGYPFKVRRAFQVTFFLSSFLFLIGLAGLNAGRKRRSTLAITTTVMTVLPASIWPLFKIAEQLGANVALAPAITCSLIAWLGSASFLYINRLLYSGVLKLIFRLATFSMGILLLLATTIIPNFEHTASVIPVNQLFDMFIASVGLLCAACLYLFCQEKLQSNHL